VYKYKELKLTLIGFILGILASLIAWFIVTHYITPNIVFASIISKIKNGDNNKYKYRIGIKNKGKRNIIDVNIIFQLLITGIDNAIPTNAEHVELKLKTQWIPCFKKQNKWALDIDISSAPKVLADKIDGDELSLEKLLSIKKSYARIILMGYDNFSGSRKLFESKKYRCEDIKEDKLYNKYYS